MSTGIFPASSGGGGSQTPWTSPIDGGGFDLFDTGNIVLGTETQYITSSSIWTTTGGWTYNSGVLSFSGTTGGASVPMPVGYSAGWYRYSFTVTNFSRSANGTMSVQMPYGSGGSGTLPQVIFSANGVYSGAVYLTPGTYSSAFFGVMWSGTGTVTCTISSISLAQINPGNNDVFTNNIYGNGGITLKGLSGAGTYYAAIDSTGKFSRVQGTKLDPNLDIILNDTHYISIGGQVMLMYDSTTDPYNIHIGNVYNNIAGVAIDANNTSNVFTFNVDGNYLSTFTIGDPSSYESGQIGVDPYGYGGYAPGTLWINAADHIELQSPVYMTNLPTSAGGPTGSLYRLGNVLMIN